MSSINLVLRKIISDSSDYCCLCFQTAAVKDEYYHLQDEVILESETAENMYKILSTVLGEQILDILSSNTICEKCTQTAIKSYQFIGMCKSNVQNLVKYITSLQNYTDNLTIRDCYKSYFLALDTDKYTVNHYYDKKTIHKNEASLHKRFKRLYFKQSQCVSNITIDIEYDPQHSDLYGNDLIEKTEIKKRQRKQHLQLSDIPHEIDNENYKCKICLKMYPTDLKLKQHYIRVHAPKNYKCPQCLRSFGSSLFLNRHINDSHCMVVCSQCGKTYTNTHSLRHHERSHKQRLVCQTCGKVYKGKHAFNNHILLQMCQKQRKSNAEATFTCDHCDKKYSRKNALRVHIRLEHENGKSLICDWCGKKLSSISRLKDHVLKHTKQKNFKCDICGGKFVTKVSLLYHTRLHTGEKPYKCDSCDLSFLSASRRSEHVKRHHTGELECDICHGKFKGQTCLSRHRKKHFDVSSRLYNFSQANKID